MRTTRLTLFFCLSSALAATLACSTLTPGATPSAPPLTAVPVITSAPTDAPPTDLPPTEALPPPTEAVPPTDAAPAAAIRLVVAAPDGAVHLADLDGQSSSIGEMQEPLYVYHPALNRDPSVPWRAFNVSSAGVFPLDVVQNVFQGFAAYVGPAAPQGRLAWDSYSIDDSGQVVGQIYVSSPDGSDARVAYAETNQMIALRVWRWAADGQRLYFSKEPLGLGGYILFTGVTNVWALNVADGSVAEVVPAGSGAVCIDDLAPDESLVAHHCTDGQAGVYAPGQALVAAIAPPPEAPELRVGDVRLSPDGSRVAFALALGNPEAEQGWAAVSDGLGGTAHLIAKADAPGYFLVAGWLDADTVLLQSVGANPGVYRAAADGSAPAQRLADGALLGVIDNLAGQP